MHATHTGRPLGRPLSAAISAAFALAVGAVPAFSEEPTPSSPPPQEIPTAGVTPVASSTPAVTDAGIIFDTSTQPRTQPKLSGPSSPSLELSRSVPFIGRRSNTRILSGFYIFAEDEQGIIQGVHPGTELPLIQRIQIEENFSQNPDLTRRRNVVGLWASIPLREGSRRPVSQDSPAVTPDGPNRTLVAALGTDTTRYRTSRKPEQDGSGQGFFSRLRPHTGILDRSKSNQTPAVEPEKAPAPQAEPTPKPETAPADGDKRTDRGLGIDFIRRLRD